MLLLINNRGDLLYDSIGKAERTDWEYTEQIISTAVILSTFVTGNEIGRQE